MPFNVDKYNALLGIAKATSCFNDQLKDAGITRNQLFDELALLFSAEENAKRYVISLLHRHYSLFDGERMVTEHLQGEFWSTTPSRDTSPSIIPDSWFSSGDDYEYLRLGSEDNTALLPPPPSSAFIKRFKEKLEAYRIDILGIAYCPEGLTPGHILLERAGDAERRQQISTIILRSALANIPNVFESTWAFDENHIVMSDCSHCQDCM